MVVSALVGFLGLLFVAYLSAKVLAEDAGAGLIGMHIATRANVRTAQAATRGFNVVSLVFAPLIIAGHRFVLQSLGF